MTFNMYNRVVITGIGIISPLGIGVHKNWTNLLNGKSGIVKLEFNDCPKIPCKVGGKIPFGIIPYQTLNDIIQQNKNLNYKSLTLASIYAMIAANEAIKDANLETHITQECEQTGVSIGCGMVDMAEIAYNQSTLMNPAPGGGYSKIGPFFMTRVLANMAAAHVAISHDCRGPNHAPSTACATGLHAIGDGYLCIKHGLADVMVCGGCEAPLYPLAYAGFSRMRALSVRPWDTPSLASRPFDSSRDGFVPSEGSAVLVLERLSHALGTLPHGNEGGTELGSIPVLRSAATQGSKKIYAEVMGYGSACDAHHVTAPSTELRAGAYSCMRRALELAAATELESTGAGSHPPEPRARIRLEDVSQTLSLGYVNAHATSTPVGDNAELRAIQTLMEDLGSEDRSKQDKVAISSNKGAIGHLLGGAGSIEAAFTALSLHHGTIPHTLNLTTPDYTSQLRAGGTRNDLFTLIKDQPVSMSKAPSGKRLVALKNSFGFGGTNASLCLAQYQ